MLLAVGCPLSERDCLVASVRLPLRPLPWRLSLDSEPPAGRSLGVTLTSQRPGRLHGHARLLLFIFASLPAGWWSWAGVLIVGTPGEGRTGGGGGWSGTSENGPQQAQDPPTPSLGAPSMAPLLPPDPSPRPRGGDSPPRLSSRASRPRLPWLVHPLRMFQACMDRPLPSSDPPKVSPCSLGRQSHPGVALLLLHPLERLRPHTCHPRQTGPPAVTPQSGATQSQTCSQTCGAAGRLPRPLPTCPCPAPWPPPPRGRARAPGGLGRHSGSLSSLCPALPPSLALQPPPRHPHCQAGSHSALCRAPGTVLGD